VGPDVACPTAVCRAPIGILGVVSVDEVRAVVLIGTLADLALETRPDLRADANAVALLDLLDILADVDGSPYNLMADIEGSFKITLAAGHGVDV